MKLNLGAGDRRIEGYISVDIAPPADQVVDLAWPWPWDDSSVEEVIALDVCEHIADCAHTLPGVYCRRERHELGRIHFMNELHRILIPGGQAMIQTPNASRGCGYFQDPTHVSPWCLSTFKYFEFGSFAHTRLGKSYGITAAFKILNLFEHETPGECAPETAWKITAQLEAVK